MNKHHRKKRDKKSRSQSVASSTYSSDLDADFHKQQYNPKDVTFKVKTSKLMGRYMVASKDLQAGSIILKEIPLVVGPCTACNVQCIGCYQPLENTDPYFKCKSCGWLLCCEKCPGLHKEFGHSQVECEVLKECRSRDYLEYEDFSKLRENLYALVPLRCLLLRETDPKRYATLLTMESHDEIRRNIPDIWATNQKTFVDRIRSTWGLKEYSEEEIHRVCGILEVNAFEVGQQGINIRALYPSAFLMSHDCVPNTSHSDEEKNYSLTVRASTNIPEHCPITLSYAYTLQSTLKRREHLLENKFFECGCRRCADPTELGTYTSALLCPKCKNGSVLSTKPLDGEASWNCTNKLKCPGYIVPAKSVQLLTDRISDEVNSLDCNDIEGMEKFLEKYRNVLHPTHYLCLGVKLSLSQLYGKINGYIIHELSDDLLLRKQNVCREILKIFDVIEPGFSRLRGVTLYELHAPIMILTTRLFERQLLSKNELRTRLKEVVRYLEEADFILGFEPETSSEGIMGLAARDALMRIKDWGRIIGKMT